jgi:hypothetical protein
MDGIKGTAKKGIKALDKLKVVWRYARQDGGQALGKVITQPAEGEPVPEPKAADWKGEEGLDETAEAQAKKSDGVTSGRQGSAALTMGSHYCCWCGITDGRAWLEESDAGERKHQPGKRRQR